MYDFLEHCACNGSAPEQFSERKMLFRNALLARMMADRTRVRYLVAPELFGKSSLACSYARFVFDFNDVWWVNGKSACLLRDLDEGSLMQDFPQVIPAGGLVVLDDVPSLGKDRAQKLWDFCQTMVTSGREVVVAATPGTDPLAAFRSYCVVIGSRDLLCTDEECSALGVRPPRTESSFRLIDRVAGLAQHASPQYERFLHALIADGQHDRAVLSFVVLSLEEATTDEIACTLGISFNATDLNVESLPFIQFNATTSTFSAKGFPLASIVRAYAPYFQSDAGDSGLRLDDALVGRVADILVRKRRFERACGFVAALCSPSKRSEWLRRWQDIMASAGALVSAEAVFATLTRHREGSHIDLQVGSLLRRVMAGDQTAALKLLQCARRSDCSLSLRLRCASTALMAPEHSAEVLRDFSLTEAAHALASVGGESSLSSQVRALLVFWQYITHSENEELDPLSVARHLDADSTSDDAAWVFACLLRARGTCDGHTCASIAQHLHALPQAEGGIGFIFLHRVLAELQLDKASIATVPMSDVCQKIQATLDAQRELFARLVPEGNFHTSTSKERPRSAGLKENSSRPAHKEDSQTSVSEESSHRSVSGEFTRCASTTLDYSVSTTSNHATFGATHCTQRPSSTANAMATASSVDNPPDITPLLQVRLFGSFSVSHGEEPVDMARLSRQKTRALLAILLLYPGQDIPGDTIAFMLWPRSDGAKARRNMYSVLSKLRGALKLPDGTCPYLKRAQGVVALVPSLVRSDCDQVGALCRSLRFDHLEPAAIVDAFNALRLQYAGEFLPGNIEDEPIARARRLWQGRTVDAALHAAQRLEEADCLQEALSVAEQALEWDTHREDCHGRLMRLQARCGQRPAAVETWLRYLDMMRAFGLDASKTMNALYEEIIGNSLGVIA